MDPALVYIHGFNSSPASFKARLLHERLTMMGRAHDFIAPALPHSPASASTLLADVVSSRPGATLVGSSLGGFYATWLAQRYDLRAVLVNPAVRPYALLAREVGKQRNFHTGEEYDFTPQHVTELQTLEVEAINPEHYLLMVETGDEVLDYRHAVERYRGCRQMIIKGGDHGFSDFAKYLDTVLAFVGM